jgi:GNAT superfamily N-acetyltransferase
MTGLALRPATADDAAAVAQIWREGWSDGHRGHVPDALVAVRTPESFSERAIDRVGDTTVAVVAGEVAGFTMVVGDELEQLYVSRSHRGSGIAEVLLADARRAIGAAGYRRAWLAVATGNARARRFYEKCGWVDEGPFIHSAPSESGAIPVPSHRFTTATVD